MTADHLRPLVEHVAVAAAEPGSFIVGPEQGSRRSHGRHPVRTVDSSAWVTFSGGLLPGRLPSNMLRRGHLSAPVRTEDEGRLRDSGSHSSGVGRCNPDTTVVSVDGIGAFDLISRNAMMQSVTHMDEGEKILPFIRAFYGQQSTCGRTT